MTDNPLLPPRQVPSETHWHRSLGCQTYTGDNAVAAVLTMPTGLMVAIDIETPSVTDSFTIKCVTAAWVEGDTTHTILLDPLRRERDRLAMAQLCKHARWLILHNAPFDVPGLVHHGMMTLDDCDKVLDTLLYARAAWPERTTKKTLESLTSRLLGMEELKGALKMAQKASGLKSSSLWYAGADIHMPAYRAGAMADTVCTLRIADKVHTAAVDRQLNHPFGVLGHNRRADAEQLIWDLTRNMQILLRRAAKGYAVDLDYLDSYVDSVQAERARAELTLRQAGLRPGIGADVIKHLEASGDLPAGWPRTKPSKTYPQGQLSADKKAMALLPDHPLALAHRHVAHTDKILGYMEKTAARSAVTGRLHPQWHVLGASVTGRMSCSEPELQQFPAEARPIILADSGGFQSVDWSSIEPALLGWMSNDWDFIKPFEAGADIYEPIMTMAGIERVVSKVVVLAAMYGQTRDSLARDLKVTPSKAQGLQESLTRAMPVAARYMRKIKAVAEAYGVAMTLSGRILPIDTFRGEVMSYKAVNSVFQGSCADMMYSAILEMDQLGAAQHIALPMHDELVVDQVGREAAEVAMSTPSARLLRYCNGHIPVVRIDSQGPLASWCKV